MSKKNSKKLMFMASVFMLAILAGCSHLPQASDTKKTDDSKVQKEMSKDEDGNIDDDSDGEVDDFTTEISEEDNDDTDGDIDDNDNDNDDVDGDIDDDNDDDDLSKSLLKSTSEETPKTGESDKEAVENREKTIVMTSFVEIIDGKYFPQFSEKEVIVKKGDKVKFKITNTKGTHDFKIDEFDVFTETPEGEEVEVEFIADKAGEFVYYCTKTGHRQNGHWGTLKVVE